MCGCECCIYDKSMHASLLSWRDWYLKNSNIKSKMLKTEGPVKCFCMYETYKNTVMPNGRHSYAKSSDMAKAKMCAYPQSDHVLSHWKYVLRRYDNCQYINITDKETYIQYSYTTPSIRFYIYHIIARCTTHGRITLKDKNVFTCVNKNLHQINLQKYTPEKS